MNSEKQLLLKPKKSWCVKKLNIIVHWHREWNRMYNNWLVAMIECGESTD